MYSPKARLDYLGVKFKGSMHVIPTRFFVLPKFRLAPAYIRAPVNFLSSRILYLTPASSSTHGCFYPILLIILVSKEVCIPVVCLVDSGACPLQLRNILLKETIQQLPNVS